jgi:hypothetical protein
MFRALDDLERAVSQLVEKTRGKAPEGEPSRSTEASAVEVITGRAINRPDQVNEEAAELIRRAIKRLKSF